MLDSQELRHELERRLAAHTGESDAILKDIWPVIVLALDEASKGALLEDPLALLDDVRREAVIQASLDAMNPDLRHSFERTIGLWADREAD